LRGRKPKSSAMLKLQKGKLYGDQAERAEAEPEPAKPLKPQCPTRFTKDEKREWHYFKKVLENYGLFMIANARLIELLATNMVHYKECTARVNSTSIIVKGPKDGFMYNPYFSAMNKIEDKIQKCLNELGLSSASLARLGQAVVKSKKAKVEEEDFI